jgi:transposase-like protein
LIAKYQPRFPGFGGTIISICARGMSTRAITGHPRALHGIDCMASRLYSPDSNRHRNWFGFATHY